uniref:Uncharacterized protein n=1 Tax=Cynoglossus semilaevis TaxID=244447 RepID=A0A3P8WL00_CYNSE
MAEDHGLCNCKAPVQIAEGFKLVFLLLADHVELLDCVQCLLFSLQLDDIGVRNHLLCKLPHRILKGRREKQHLAVLGQLPPLDSNALVTMTLRGDHHISLIQDKQSDVFGVNILELGAPIENCAWCSDDNLLIYMLTVFLWLCVMCQAESFVHVGFIAQVIKQN